MRSSLAVSERLGKPVDAGAAIRQYATQGFDIVIAHGSQYQSVVKEIAPEFPKVTFAYGAGFQTGPNIFAYDVQAQEGGYILGVLAAKMSKSKIVGIVGPVEAGDAVKYNKGFMMGVAAAGGDVKTRIAYTGSFNEIVKAGEVCQNTYGCRGRLSDWFFPTGRRSHQSGCREAGNILAVYGYRPKRHRARFRSGIPTVQLGKSHQPNHRPSQKRNPGRTAPRCVIFQWNAAFEV